MALAFSKTSSADLAEFHAALEAALERALAAAAGVDLRFDHDQLGAAGEKFFRDGPGCFRRVADVARRDGHAVLREQLFGLIFVNVHVRKKTGLIERSLASEINL